MLASLPHPLVFAHRGASAFAPENTLAAFALALEHGAPAIEFDVKLTMDRHVVLMHDQTVDRTTNGKGAVTQQSLAILKALDAGSWKDEKYRGEKIPTLDEVFATFGRKLFMNVELTNYATPFDGLVHEVTKRVKEHGLEEHVIFSSFFPTNLVIGRRLLPKVPRGQLALSGHSGWWQRLAGNFMALDAEHPYTDDVTADSVARAHSKNRRVHVWTVNNPDNMRRLKNLGVDGIFTDDPRLALKIFAE
jgi:glycerophosphoryl diester phosphodiesterase